MSQPRVASFVVIAGLAVTLVAVLGTRTPAAAQDAGADVVRRARSEFAQGVESFEAERFEEALGHFLAAWQIRPHPTVRVNLASCYAKLGRPAAAVLHYKAYLADRNVQVSRAARREIQATLTGLEQRVGAVDLALSPREAAVTVDGAEPEARDGTRLYLVAGTHRIAATAPGRSSATRTIEVAARSTQSVALELAAAPTATTAVATVPEPARTPTAADDTARATDALDATDDSDVDDTTLSTDEPDEPLDSEGPTGSGGGRIFQWGAFGLAGAAAIGATVLGVMALGASDDFDAGATQIEQHDYADDAERSRIDRQARDDADRARSLALWTDVCVVVAAGAAITGTIIALTTPAARATPDEARLSIRVAGAPTPEGGTVVLTASF